MNVLTSPPLVALVAAGPSVLLGWFAYRHSRKVDAVAEQGMIATVETGTIGQVIDGLNKIIAALQSDNVILRVDKLALAECERQLADLRSRVPRAPTET